MRKTSFFLLTLFLFNQVKNSDTPKQQKSASDLDDDEFVLITDIDAAKAQIAGMKSDSTNSSTAQTIAGAAGALIITPAAMFLPSLPLAIVTTVLTLEIQKTIKNRLSSQNRPKGTTITTQIKEILKSKIPRRTANDHHRPEKEQ